MIEHALTISAREVNQFLRLRYDLNEDKVLSGSLISQDGSVSIQDENKVILTLVDIEQETTLKNGSRYHETTNGTTYKSPDLHLNLFILLSAYFNPLNYTEALKYLSAVISFFHAKPVFNTSNSPELIGTGIDKLVFEIFHQDSNGKNNLWSTLGAKYMPSIQYKVRMLTISDASIRQQIDGIHNVGLDKNIP